MYKYSNLSIEKLYELGYFHIQAYDIERSEHDLNQIYLIVQELIVKLVFRSLYGK
jgi:hypothetical protein